MVGAALALLEEDCGFPELHLPAGAELQVLRLTAVEPRRGDHFQRLAACRAADLFVVDAAHLDAQAGLLFG